MESITSREFNHDVSRAKRDSVNGPVVITDRGRPSHVLMSIQEYERLRGAEVDIFHQLSTDDGIDIEFDPVDLGLNVPEL